jgi:hypothetical protein
MGLNALKSLNLTNGRKRVTGWKQRSCVPPGRVKTNKQTYGMEWPVPEEIWKEVFSQICAKLTYIVYFGIAEPPFDYLAPLENAKKLSWLKIQRALLTSETVRQMADNYTCLQSVDLHDVDCSKNSAMEYFLEKQSHTLTSLKITTDDKNPLPAISKCRNLKKLDLFLSRKYPLTNLDRLGSLSMLKCLRLQNIGNNDLGNCIATAKFQDLTEINFRFAYSLSDEDVSQIAQTYGEQV